MCKKLINRLGRLTVVGLCGWLFTGCPLWGVPVLIPDAQLEAAIRAELGLPLGFVTRGHMLQLRALDVRSSNVRDLTGLEFATNLTFLDASGNSISDITPLAGLTNLLNLNLDGTDVFEISALAGLVNLDSVSLCGTLITDIQALVTNAVNNGLGPGDFVNLNCDALTDQAQNVDIPFLESLGVSVFCCSSDGGGGDA